MWYVITCGVTGLIVLVVAMCIDEPRVPWTKPGYGKRRRTDGMKGVEQHIGGDKNGL